jgi:hypothetical protein
MHEFFADCHGIQPQLFENALSILLADSTDCVYWGCRSGTDRVGEAIGVGVCGDLAVAVTLIGHRADPPVAQARASKGTPLKWTKNLSEPDLAGFLY